MNNSGRHFLQIPGPTNVPDRILRAMDYPTMDHRSAGFAELGVRVLSGLKEIFKTSGDIFIFPASGTGAWEAALVNTRIICGFRPIFLASSHHRVAK